MDFLEFGERRVPEHANELAPGQPFDGPRFGTVGVTEDAVVFEEPVTFMKSERVVVHTPGVVEPGPRRIVVAVLVAGLRLTLLQEHRSAPSEAQ